MTPPGTLLAIDRLTVAAAEASPSSAMVHDVSLRVGRGEIVGLVGESGSGKTTTALSILRLLPAGLRVETGRIRFQGVELLACSEGTLREVRGGRIGVIFQESLSAFNPTLTIGFQIREAIRAHSRVSRLAARRESERLLELVAMPNPRERLRCFPHQLSGGQRQRAAIAMALAARPSLLIADEPTTALDVTLQAQILELFASLRDELQLAVLLITHDLAVVAQSCDRVAVMYAGEIVEDRPVRQLFGDPGHPYTQGLLAALPGRAAADRGQLLTSIPGQMPAPGSLPRGCPFHPRCDQVLDRCGDATPSFVSVGEGYVRCFLFEGRRR